MTIHEQIKSRREALNWSMEQLAAAISTREGLVKPLAWQTVQQWENGTSAPRRKRLEVVAQVLGCTVPELLEIKSDNVESIRVRRTVPLVSWVRAGAWGDVSDPFHPGEADEWIDVYDTLPGDQAFALRVTGDSMTNPHPGAEHNFPDGTIIVVDPSRGIEANCFVVAKDVQTQQATFKRLVTDSGRWFLRPLNPAFPTIEIDDPAMRVIGRVVEWKRGGRL
jgi:SOS-response transcriptional repressor LexA